MKTTITTPARANIALAKGNNDRIVFPCRSQCSYLTSFERSRCVRRNGMLSMLSLV